MRDQKRGGVLGYNEAIDGAQQQGTAQRQHREGLAVRSMIYVTHSHVLPEIFSLEFGNFEILNTVFFSF